MAVIEGDQATEQDALRLRETGAKVIQINTGKGMEDFSWLLNK